MKKVLAGIVAVVIVLTTIMEPVGASAAKEPGMPVEEVIKISSAKEMQKMAEDLSADYILTEDIDLEGVEWTPIGSNGEAFTGSLDGGGHMVSNLDITVKDSSESSFAGLFGVLENAAVVNLAVEDCDLKSETTGGVYAGVITGKMKNSLIEDVYVSGKISVEEKAAYSVGGIAGAVFQNEENGTFTQEHNVARCVSSVEISVPEEMNGEKGTLAGYVEDTALVENS